MKKNIAVVLLLSFVLLQINLQAQNRSDTATADTLNKKRLYGLVITEGSLYAAGMAGLYVMWYSDYPQTRFHWINDNDEWLQLDKVGHSLASYNLCKFSYESLRWTGVSSRKALLYGGLTGFAYEGIIEVLDGFSGGWGASSGDLIANTSGTLLFIGQQLAWNEQRIMLKYTFHRSGLAKYRPDLLGKNFAEESQKDYNGITLFLSANIASFLPKDNNFPKWLNLAVGYGADGMTGAEHNMMEYEGKVIPHYDRKRQFYLSPDIDFSRIKTNSKTLKIILYALNVLKFPAPAIELNDKGTVKFHALYY